MSDKKSLLKSKNNEEKSQNYGAIVATETNTPSPSSSSSQTSLDSTKNQPEMPLDLIKTSTINLYEKLGFGLGHVYNDLCAGVWFSYTLLFMQHALLISAPLAGALVMLGQVGDAIATPIVGYLADKYGTKRQWHIFGTSLIFATFPMIFSLCPGCATLPNWWEPTYFGVIILIFQFGWAIVQITHLAMIPEMSRTQQDRSDLTSIRYSASVISSVVVFIVTWAVLHARNKTDSNIGPADAYRFRDISLILTLMGLSMSVLFHFSLSLSGYENRRRLALPNRRVIKEKSIEEADETARLLPSSSSSDVTVIRNGITPQTVVERKNFLKSPLLYQNAFLYVFSRLFLTTSLIYLPLWLDERSYSPPGPQINNSLLQFAAPSKSVEHIATVPLVSFLASFVSSIFLRSGRLGHQFSYLIGSLTSIGACTWVFLSPSASSAQLYGIAVLFGAGSSITMISSLCITADMIGPHADQSGFIYSAVTFADKLITGVVVIIIETLKCEKREDCPQYYRTVLSYGCGIAAILGMFVLATLKCTRRAIRDSSQIN